MDISKMDIGKIDKQLGGDSLTEEYICSFEEAYRKVLSTQSDQQIKETIENLAKILEISEKNLEFVKNEKWFQRAWYTISGKNRKLEKQNNHNLLLIQKGAIYFLNNIASENVNLMLIVHYCLERIQNNQVQDEKIKLYLIEWTRRNNLKMKNFEMRLEKCENVLELKQNKGIFSAIRRFFTGNIDGLSANKYYHSNMAIKNETVENLCKVLINRMETNSYTILDPFLNVEDKFSSLFDSIGEKQKSEKFAETIQRMIELDDLKSEMIDKLIIETVNSNLEFINSFYENIINNFIPQSPYRLQAEVPYQEKARIIEVIVKRCQGIKREIDNSNELRLQLLGMFPKFKKVISKKHYIELGANTGLSFAAGLFLAPIGIGLALGPIGIGLAITNAIWGNEIIERVSNYIGIETDKKAILSFSQTYEEYIAKWNEILNNSYAELYEVVCDELRSFTRSYVLKTSDIFNDFSEYDVDLSLLNKNLIDMIYEYEKENVS